MLFFVSIWCFVLIACAMKTVEYFLDTKDKNSFSNGLLMSIITFAMAAMLWFWLIIFSSSVYQNSTSLLYTLVIGAWIYMQMHTFIPIFDKIIPIKNVYVSECVDSNANMYSYKRYYTHIIFAYFWGYAF